MNFISVAKLVISLAICQLAGLAGTFFTAPNIATWYASLNKPFFAPPNWLFAPVWITLFFLMGLALFLVWDKKIIGLNGRRKKDAALLLFVLQLFLNILWSGLFFGLRSPIAGLIGIIVLWIAIVVTMQKFRFFSKKAFWLLVPYIVWVSIATVLNLAIALLN